MEYLAASRFVGVARAPAVGVAGSSRDPPAQRNAVRLPIGNPRPPACCRRQFVIASTAAVVDNGRVSASSRTEAFSDGVLAIAVTLLVLDLRVPAEESLHGSLASALARQWPVYAAYVTSFLVIGIIWVNHHAVFELIGAVDRITLFLNLLLLMP